KLARDVVRGPGGDLGLLHELQEVGLNPAPADITDGRVAGGRDLVDLVEVNDPELGLLDVTIGAADEIANEVLDITSDIARFRELGGVGLDEGHADQLGDAPNEVGLAHPGGTQ